MESLRIDGHTQFPVRKPSCVAEIGDIIRDAIGSNHGIYPFGGRTAIDIGLDPTKPGVALDTRGLSEVIDYPARDMTITVRAGMSIQALQEVLASEGQRLPVDVPEPSAATIGGALAVNSSGPRRLGRGTFRDYVIGIGFLSDDATEISGGGRVVKNVAGYDLMKLHIGALGTLGIITRVTLKVTPKPEDQAIVAFGLTTAAVGPTLDRLANSNSRPIALELLNAPAIQALSKLANSHLPGSDPWAILAGFEEKTATVDWQVKTLQDELKTAPVRDLMVLRGQNGHELFDSLTSLQGHRDSCVSWKAAVLPSRVARFAADAESLSSDMLIHAHAGSGIVFGHLPAGEVTAEQSSVIISSLAARAAESGGSLIVLRCPAEWKRLLPAWGSAVGGHKVMRAVKRSLDPSNIFNPGRLFVDM